MLDRIVRIKPDEYMVVFDNRAPIIVTSDVGNALFLIECLLSPRWDMSHTEYHNVLQSNNEDTNPMIRLDVA